MKFKRNLEITNKYRLTPKSLRKYVVGDRTEVCEPLFWRNNVINAWCISRQIGGDISGDSFWIGIYDEDAPEYKGKFRFYFTSWGDMCGYEFDKFFEPSEIEYEQDLRIQEAFIQAINMLIDKGIIVKPKK